MNCKTANQISLVDWLKKEGFTPTKTDRHNYWFCSPLRHEDTASFKVDINRNQWYDFGLGIGGSLIDLVSRLYQKPIATALEILEGNTPGSKPFVFHKPKKVNPSPGLKVVSVQRVKYYPLIQYMKQRCIYNSYTLEYIYEATVEINNKTFRALGFKNDMGGFELRNSGFKGSSSPKAITTINPGQKSLSVFEGFIDFASALTRYHVAIPSSTVIVLNSVSNTKNIIELLKNYKSVHLFLDNDTAGLSAANEIALNHNNVKNQSQKLFPHCNDFNDYLITLKTKQNEHFNSK